MRESTKAAFGGIISALSVIIMLITYLSPMLVYTAPPFAGLLLIIIVNELNKKWAFGTYVSVSLLSLFLIADKESAVFYTFFFGYYPVLHIIFEEKIRNRLLKIILKLIIFNTSVFAAVMVCQYIFNISYDDFNDLGKYSYIIFILLINILLLFYDILLKKMQILYKIKFRPKIKKIFGIKK